MIDPRLEDAAYALTRLEAARRLVLLIAEDPDAEARHRLELDKAIRALDVACSAYIADMELRQAAEELKS